MGLSVFHKPLSFPAGPLLHPGGSSMGEDMREPQWTSIPILVPQGMDSWRSPSVSTPASVPTHPTLLDTPRTCSQADKPQRCCQGPRRWRIRRRRQPACSRRPQQGPCHNRGSLGSSHRGFRPRVLGPPASVMSVLTAAFPPEWTGRSQPWRSWIPSEHGQQGALASPLLPKGGGRTNLTSQPP